MSVICLIDPAPGVFEKDISRYSSFISCLGRNRIDTVPEYSGISRIFDLHLQALLTCAVSQMGRRHRKSCPHYGDGHVAQTLAFHSAAVASSHSLEVGNRSKMDQSLLGGSNLVSRLLLGSFVLIFNSRVRTFFYIYFQEVKLSTCRPISDTNQMPRIASE